ncbi:hypothetical protein [Caloramator sp. Dgby_cultured_2]|uniref:hypothetical protein n=1 Tax=Caloramator sp. Dgby_cultured_2 TaxID=3029174 RepID=UPI00406C92DA
MKQLRTVPIGGQAVIEGVMMRGERKIAIAVRDAKGNINVSVEENVPLSKKHKILGMPIIRGVAAFLIPLLRESRLCLIQHSFSKLRRQGLKDI